jgi:two-component system, chemotaxis family, sensor kinase Cph1
MSPENRQSIRLIAVLSSVGLAIAFACIGLLYNTAIREQGRRLRGMAQSYARLTEAMAAHEEHWTHLISLPTEHGDAYQAVVDQLREAEHGLGGFGRTGEIKVGRHIGDSIFYLVAHRGDSAVHPAPVPFEGPLARPMKLALSGRSGAGILTDYRGVRVLAAYEPVKVFDLGIVAKLDLAEVQAPFIRTGLLVLAAAIVFLGGGGLLLLAAAAPERRRLREFQERFRQLSNSLPQLVWTCLPEGPCDFLSDQWVKYTGIPAEPQLGFGWLEQLHPDDRERTVAAWNAAVASGSDFHVEFRIRRHDGEYRWFDTRAVRLRDAEGRTVKWFGSNTDVTDRKRAEAEKDRLAREVERRKVELEQLIYAASHDLRTPLVSVQGFVGELRLSMKDLLAELGRPGVPPDVRKSIAKLADADIPESLKFIEAGAARMSALLSGLLRLSRLGRTTFHAQSLDMNHVVSQIVQSLEFAARKAGAKVEVTDLPAALGDPMQMGQVFSNLVENAFKYRSPDRPLVIRITGRFDDGMAVYSVEDNGIGIAPEQQQRVFTPFFQVDSRASAGEGLGLTIVTRIVERLGGRVWVESEPGKGSRFIVALPAGEEEARGEKRDG